jgi:hypothetical protein
MIRAVCWVVYAPGRYGENDREVSVCRVRVAADAIASLTPDSWIVREFRYMMPATQPIAN